MQNIFSYIILLTLGALLFWWTATYLWWRYLKQRKQLLTQLGLEKKKKAKVNIGQLLIGFTVKLGQRFEPVGKRFTLFVDASELKRQLSLAGYPQGLNRDSFYGLRFVTSTMGLIFGNFYEMIGLPLASAMPFLGLAAGFLGPWYWLKYLAKERQEELAARLPDFLDAMSVTLQAGVPMDPAMHQVAEYLEGPLGEEITRLNQELDLGVPRDEAYKRLVSRNDCMELETLVHSLVQGSQLGVPISTTFKVIAEDIRTTRLNKIKEKAAKASPKVTLVTSFLILPAVMLTIVGMIALNIIYTPENMGLDSFIN